LRATSLEIQNRSSALDSAVNFSTRAVDAGLNYLELLPTDDEAALQEDIKNAPRFGTPAK
jgi:hypothetical protein